MSRIIIAAVLAATLTAAGCSSSDESTTTVAGPDELPGQDLPAAITCPTQYRPDAEQLTGAEEPTLTVERSDDLDGASAGIDFANMTLTVGYVGDVPEGRVVTVTVETLAGEQLVSTLYQLGDIPVRDIDFAGGHGFTGLQYVHHDGALLQVWCQATS